jgi:hypothetical protein
MSPAEVPEGSRFRRVGPILPGAENRRRVMEDSHGFVYTEEIGGEAPQCPRIRDRQPASSPKVIRAEPSRVEPERTKGLSEK